MRYNPQDPYFQRAKAEGYVARSVYKLIEIDKRYNLLKEGVRVVDLGASPGSWSQFLAQKGGPTAKILAIDLQPMRWGAPQVEFYLQDVFSSAVEARLAEPVWDGILSDMAPATTGHRVTDHVRSAALVERSLYLAKQAIRPGGFWVAKLLEGPERERLRKEAEAIFTEVFVFRPASTRKGSTECFFIGRLRKKQ